MSAELFFLFIAMKENLILIWIFIAKPLPDDRHTHYITQISQLFTIRI